VSFFTTYYYIKIIINNLKFMIMQNDFKKDPTVTAKLNSIGSETSVKTFTNSQGDTTGFRPCTIVYKGNIIRATIWESVVAQGVKVGDECTVAVTKGTDRDGKPAVYCKVIGGSAMLPTEDLFADVFAEEKELTI
jgi:hypothetical protein